MDATGPADTLTEMIAGYSVIFGILTIYVVSLFLRFKKLREEKQMLMALKEDELD